MVQRAVPVLFLWLGSAPIAAPLAAPSAAQGALLVTSRFSDQVLRYDAQSGDFLGVFATGGGLDNPVGLTFGPDGNLYVASGETDEVLRYDGTTGAPLGSFGGGGLDAPRQLNFGPDGDLFVASGATNEILRFDAASGTFLGVFAAGGGLNGPTSFTFGPDGDLYVGSVLDDRILRFDGESGAFLGPFVTDHIDGPHDLAFGPDHRLYVSNAFAARIVRFDGASGAFVDVFVSDLRLSAALGLSWNEAGDLVVVNQGRDEVRRYDGVTGELLGTLVVPGTGGLDGPLFATLEPSPGFAVQAPIPGVAGVSNVVVITGAPPGAGLWLGVGDHFLARALPGPAGPWWLAPLVARSPLVADESGRAFLRATVPAEAAGDRYLLWAFERASRRASPITRHRF
jgi:hypothetical protein